MAEKIYIYVCVCVRRVPKDACFRSAHLPARTRGTGLTDIAAEKMESRGERVIYARTRSHIKDRRHCGGDETANRGLALNESLIPCMDHTLR